MKQLLALAAICASLVLAACTSDPCAGCAGCCNAAGRCESGSSTNACGAGGVTCSTCGASQQCSAGVCATAAVGGAGGGSGGGSVVFITTPDGGSAVSVGSGDTCAGLSQLVAEAEALRGDCTDLVSPVPVTEANCRERLPACTAQDRPLFDSYFNCMRRLDRCTAQNRETLRQRQNACIQVLNSVSRPCLDALLQPSR